MLYKYIILWDYSQVIFPKIKKKNNAIQQVFHGFSGYWVTPIKWFRMELTRHLLKPGSVLYKELNDFSQGKYQPSPQTVVCTLYTKMRRSSSGSFDSSTFMTDCHLDPLQGWMLKDIKLPLMEDINPQTLVTNLAWVTKSSAFKSQGGHRVKWIKNKKM